MSSKRIITQTIRLFLPSTRVFSTSKWRFDRQTEQEHRKHQIDRPLNPHITNTTSTITNEMPSLGKDKPPPEMISSVDGDFVPEDSVPENTEHMTGGTQMSTSASDRIPDKELEVGEMEGASFKVEPKRRFGEDMNTLRARLQYQSRKRGILESDLLLSTFADENLDNMTKEQLMQYDVFLDENDWDIYYWATQEPIPTSTEYPESGSPSQNTAATQDQPSKLEKDGQFQAKPRSGEWAQTVGAFKPAYRPVPQRWKHSEILAMLRKHVKDRSAGTGHEEQHPLKEKSSSEHVDRTNPRGLAFMPPVRNFDTR